MDATMLTVVGTGLTVVATGIAAFVALWKVQGRQFDTMDRRMQDRHLLGAAPKTGLPGPAAAG